MNNIPASEIIDSCKIAGPGYVNVVLARQWMAKVVTFPHHPSSAYSSFVLYGCVFLFHDVGFLVPENP